MDIGQDDIDFLKEIAKVPGFAHITPDEAGIEALETMTQELEKDLAEVQSMPFEGMTVDAKVSDLNREIVLTIRTPSDDTFKALSRMAPVMPLIPLWLAEEQRVNEQVAAAANLNAQNGPA